MPEYVGLRVGDLPRLPLEGHLDPTYRCNNDCRHCWNRVPPEAPERHEELGLEKIKRIVDEARALGTRQWAISGGEPMLRPDFPELFDFVTRKSSSYSLNTNGTLITPEIARLMTRKGRKMVAIYGATAEVHDHVTRRPGSFEETMRGFACLREAGASFIVQIVPMRDNYRQFDSMVRLAETLSPHHRIGASWLYLRGDGDRERNREILRQRLDPRDVIDLDKPEPPSRAGEGDRPVPREGSCQGACGDDRLFAGCIANRKDFHIDPYGGMGWCAFVQDPVLRYDLRRGSLADGWESFIPCQAESVRGGAEYLDQCGACERKSECRWCPAYAKMEHGRFSARVEYLCAVTGEKKSFEENWSRNHRRYFRCADVTIEVDSDLPISEGTFHPKLKAFEVEGPGEDVVSLRHHFRLPETKRDDLGEEVYRKAPWAIYRRGDSVIYLGISPDGVERPPHKVMVFNLEHTRGRVYSDGEDAYRKGSLESVSFFPSDQILLARVLADRGGCYLHSAGVIMGGQGLLFIGHSEAGKSTMIKMLRGRAEILCDDRMIVRKGAGGFSIHGTWSHGEVPDISPCSAPLGAVFFLEKAPENRAIRLEEGSGIARRLLGFVVRPFETADWWRKTLDVVERLGREVPAYDLKFDKSGEVVDQLETLCSEIRSGGRGLR